MESKNIKLKYRYDLATSNNLKKALRNNPIGLHFSTHGHVNCETFYQDDCLGLAMNCKNKNLIKPYSVNKGDIFGVMLDKVNVKLFF